jgi:hypothetical protein
MWSRTELREGSLNIQTVTDKPFRFRTLHGEISSNTTSPGSHFLTGAIAIAERFCLRDLVPLASPQIHRINIS